MQQVLENNDYTTDWRYQKKYIDEYRNPNKGTTGGHIHIEDKLIR